MIKDHSLVPGQLFLLPWPFYRLNMMQNSNINLHLTIQISEQTNQISHKKMPQQFTWRIPVNQSEHKMAQHARITKVMSAWTIVPTFKSWTAG
jgi:hypothetical protein